MAPMDAPTAHSGTAGTQHCRHRDCQQSAGLRNIVYAMSLLTILVAGYAEYLRVPEWIAVNIAYTRHALSGKVVSAPYAHGVKTDLSTATSQAVTSQWDESSYGDDLAAFDDRAFMRQYKCDKKHGYRLRMLSRDPQLMYVQGFLAPGEADHLRALGLPKMNRSTVVGEERVVHEARTSHNAFLSKSEDAVVTCVEQRVADFLQKPVINIEPLQVVWYRDGQEYKPHYDYFPEGAAGTEKELLRGGQRLATFFVYLNTVPEEHGGHTTFPTLALDVPAVKNDAAFWYDVTPDGKDDPRTFHGGSPVHDAEKWGLNVWIRHNAFK